MKSFIEISLEIEGMHCWPAAREMFQEVAYLSDKHRHLFVIRCRAEVSHGDRQIEFIMLKHEVKKYFGKYYKPEIGMCDFGSMSCEHIAAELIERFDLFMCSVHEDGENGAVVYR